MIGLVVVISSTAEGSSLVYLSGSSAQSYEYQSLRLPLPSFIITSKSPLTITTRRSRHGVSVLFCSKTAACLLMEKFMEKFPEPNKKHQFRCPCPLEAPFHLLVPELISPVGMRPTLCSTQNSLKMAQCVFSRNGVPCLA
jgi:hypothetical protein